MTLEELKQFDGKEGRPAYIGFEGKVYDVTQSYSWRGGQHFVLHQAGTDLTEALKEAPHGSDLLRRFPIVDTLQSS